MAKGLENANFDMSGVRTLNKAVKPGPGRPRSRPIDPNWSGLKNIEEQIYTSLNADIDIDKLNDQINAAREARETLDAKQYAAALRNLIDFHYDSFKLENSYSNLSIDQAFKNDELLSSDPRALAFARGAIHGKDRQGLSVKTLSESLQDAKSNFRSNRADVRAHIAALGGDWDTKGAIKLADDLETEFTAEFKRQGSHDAEAEFRAKRKVFQTLNEMSSDPQRAFVLLTSKDQNASIKLYMDGKSSKMTPMIDENDIVLIRDGILAARINKFNKDPINVNVMSNDTAGGVPKVVEDQLEDGDLAFTYFGGDGVYIYPEKMKKLLVDGIDANWFSTETLDKKDLYKHLIVHETGHLQMYKLWGDGTGTGRQALEKDFTTFKVKKNGTSVYGNESVSESFAEQYAKYLITGDASPEFLELLASKGLTKAQINKRWRGSYANLLDDRFFKFLDGIQLDNQQAVIPEFNGPEAKEYTENGKYGARDPHKIARILGFLENKPKIVSSIEDDEQVVYRGVRPPRIGPFSSMSELEIHDHVKYSDMPYYTFGIHGDGYYSTKKRTEASDYARTQAVKMRVADDAKIYVEPTTSQFGFDRDQKNGGVDISKLHDDLFKSGGILEEIVLNEIDPDATGRELTNLKNELAKKMGLNTSYKKSKTILAVLMGFQGIEVIGNEGASYAVFIDRSMIEMLP